MGNIIDKGPSVIFVQDTDGHIFGGFASTSWTISPQFTGNVISHVKHRKVCSRSSVPDVASPYIAHNLKIYLSIRH